MKLRVRCVAWMAPVLGPVLSTPAAHSQCPLNYGRIGVLQNCANPQSTAPIFSMSGSECINGSGSLSYDLVAGTIEVSSYSYSYDIFETWLQTQDDFVIEGPSSATPIRVVAILNVTAYRSEIQLSSGIASVSSDDAGPANQTLRLDLDKLPGEHFTLGILVSSHGDPDQGTASGRGTLRFTSLPPGYALTSCQGYAALPVATRATSWGRLKQIYR